MRDRKTHLIYGRNKYRIPGGLRGRYLKAKNRNLLELKRSKGDLVSEDFLNRYWKPAREALKAESNKKCAYCEAPTSVVAHGDIEHYRPKTSYWWLAYCYDNYLYSCQVCNQIHKSDHFPISGTRLTEPNLNSGTTDAELDELAGRLCPDPIKTDEGYSLDEYINDCMAERPLLLNPYMDYPEKHMAWKAIPALKEVHMIAMDGSNFSAEAIHAMEKYPFNGIGDV
jgi:uncharacterized protein (TIGR02646 family)